MRGPVFREVQSSSFEEPNIELSLRSFRGCRWQARQVRQPFQEGSGQPVVAFAPATPDDLRPGAVVFATAQCAGDGMLTSGRVMVGNNGVVPPMWAIISATGANAQPKRRGCHSDTIQKQNSTIGKNCRKNPGG
ncbi:MAG: hypothetical protein EOS54_10490 [Mesorhizobium sp.]|uniref:hypothetical protein n=1 Tax=unclassified Mesorhizobium TaxID=325217 RepID=UPI000F7600E6|nr:MULTISPECIES: hypothetical protein [unclassified Mesorhizobium]AZO47461.1 hypothetical protein EJ073_06115 [Mesorhizobium sp. M4B.F.Ca.ET.058.02.1.1]RVC41829.1 hypothetical protein EN781_24665 [Mesorhizobium sp. M4A.F.Ca.ET.090.04.2.1]RWC54433.1 MAG: hypothetical protein EOS54_10490 [Mesorhizobium sp.]RWD13359.1 MAG: hypothetical protein EOS74_21535 [Mesorhizobium sp.]RWD53420.1 MAG: hypothetical protein EOS75_26690 [Mesorhizobium sp.]